MKERYCYVDMQVKVGFIFAEKHRLAGELEQENKVNSTQPCTA